ncbi:dienelactone hydrolase [Hoeflea olei]|uniref:Dienelactone hydrolase n=1 Tax=Hoeflea olei TaxID=1480615 RepID=A0A1C1YYS0_9HYPH|nr:dienelactone hydrolase [Hoeflea olei]
MATATFSLAPATARPALAAEAGTRTLAIPSAARGRDLAVTLWYPAQGDGETVAVGDNRVFAGTSASENAQPAAGRHPLVVLSHGSGSTVQAMAWLAARLAQAGYIVAGPNHPGTTSGDSSPADTAKIWARVDDLSTVVSALLADPGWSGSIDADRIGVLGFSLGGATAMEMAGARADLEAYAGYCDANPSMADCRWYRGGRAFVDGEMVAVDPVDLRQVDRDLFERDNRDPRIKAAVLVDPALARAFTPESLERIAIPMSFINLGAPGSVPVAVEAQGLAALTPQGTHATVAGAIHYSFLAECKPDAKAFLASVGDTDPICDDGGTRSRAELHRELVDLIKAELDRSLAP